MAFGRVVALTLSLVACTSADDRAKPPEVQHLPAGIAARVGDEEISYASVQRIAVAQAISPDRARDRAISDALFAAHARRVMAGSGSVESAERSALARAMLENVRREAEKRGPPSDAEVEAITNERWLDLARPPLARTTHAVVLFSQPADGPKAKRVADAIAQAVDGVTDSTAFDKKAREVPSEGLEVRVEHLLPVAPDGRVGDPKAPPGTPEAPPLERDFARATHAIPEVGGKSPVTQTRYGYHVILLEERLPERSFSLEERRALIAPEAMARRAREITNALLEQSKPTKIELDRSVVDLLSRVQVSR